MVQPAQDNGWPSLQVVARTPSITTGRDPPSGSARLSELSRGDTRAVRQLLAHMRGSTRDVQQMQGRTLNLPAVDGERVYRILSGYDSIFIDEARSIVPAAAEQRTAIAADNSDECPDLVSDSEGESAPQQ